jgi:hypothetical protein
MSTAPVRRASEDMAAMAVAPPRGWQIMATIFALNAQRAPERSWATTDVLLNRPKTKDVSATRVETAFPKDAGAWLCWC